MRRMVNARVKRSTGSVDLSPLDRFVGSFKLALNCGRNKSSLQFMFSLWEVKPATSR